MQRHKTQKTLVEGKGRTKSLPDLVLYLLVSLTSVCAVIIVKIRKGKKVLMCAADFLNVCEAVR